MEARLMLRKMIKTTGKTVFFAAFASRSVSASSMQMELLCETSHFAISKCVYLCTNDTIV